MQRIANRWISVVFWSVGWSVTIMNSAKTAEPIEMPFAVWNRVVPSNHVLDRGPDPPWEGTIWGNGLQHCKVYGLPPCAAAMRPFVKLL